MAIVTAEPSRPETGPATRPSRVGPAGQVISTPSRGRIASLDGLRGVALVAVLAYHVAPSSVHGGFLGVESFFVLSGYLLGALLLDERRRTGRIHGRVYARRRFRRIAPALAVLLVVLVACAPAVAPDQTHRLRGDVLSSVAGVTNWHLIADQSSYFGRFAPPPLVRHLWSIAVEIQFYLLCPLVVAWLARRRRGIAIAALGAGVGLSAAVMAVLYRSGDPSRAYYGTDARVGALLAGLLLAFLLAEGHRPADGRGGRRPLAVLGPVALAALVVLFLLAQDRARLAYPAAFLATQALTATVIAASLRPGPLASLLTRRELRWLGLRSYGIYLWHWPAVVLLGVHVGDSWPAAVVAASSLAIAMVLGALSYGLVERPMVRSPSPAARRHPRRARGVVFALGAVVAAQFTGLLILLPGEDPLAETLREGQRVLAAQPARKPPPSAMPAPSTTTAPTPAATSIPPGAPPAPGPGPGPGPEPGPGPTPATPPVPAAAPAPTGVAVTAIGDSVMVSAAGALRARLGPSGYIDAVNRRQFSDAVDIARAMREQGLLGKVVIVHLGNNGPVRGSHVDALMAELAGVPSVLLVNVRVNGFWQDSVNQTFADAARRHPAIRLVDWHHHSDGHPDWFQSDGTHFKATSGPGAHAYADLLAGSVPPA